MLPLNDYLEPLLLTLVGLMVFALDLLIFGLMLDRQITGFGFVGFGVAIAGGWRIAETWQERRDLLRCLRECERQERVQVMVDQLDQ